MEICVLLIFQVTFGKHKVTLGNILKPCQMKNIPSVNWWVDDSKRYYTLSMVGK